MISRSTALALALTAGVGVLAVGTASPALAQGDPVPGSGNLYSVSGAYDPNGQAQFFYRFGNADDQVYVGDWYGRGYDLPMVRRGNVFSVSDTSGYRTASVFTYGDPGDQVYIGDWDGDGVDSIAVRRGNHYFVKDDNTSSGVADRVFVYGDPGDEVLVGNWDGTIAEPVGSQPGKGDTLTVVRGNEFFVKNSITTGTADYTFRFGDPGDELLVGDWATVTTNSDGSTALASGDGADQLAVVRGNVFHLSSEFEDAAGGAAGLTTQRRFAYGDPGDAVFVSAYPTHVDSQNHVTNNPGIPTTVITGDGIGVRRTH